MSFFTKKTPVISESKEDFGRLKPLIYRKPAREDKDAIFKPSGVVHEESF